MLKMKCSNCNEFIVSPLLAEIETVSCSHCRQVVPVSNVVVSSQGFSIHREDLLRRFFRYQKLLTEVIRERELMQESPDISADSRNSVDRFITTLEEVMDGARNNFRLHFSWGLPVRISVDQRIRTGKLVNLSMEGACIEPEDGDAMPKVQSPLSLEFTLPERTAALSLAGVVVWANRRRRTQTGEHGIGVRFTGLSDSARAELWQYIVDHVKLTETGDGNEQMPSLVNTFGRT
jgi:hypothetical protein